MTDSKLIDHIPGCLPPLKPISPSSLLRPLDLKSVGRGNAIRGRGNHLHVDSMHVMGLQARGKRGVDRSGATPFVGLERCQDGIFLGRSVNDGLSPKTEAWIGTADNF